MLGKLGRKTLLASAFVMAAAPAIAADWGNGDATLVVSGDCVAQNVNTATWVNNCDYKNRTVCDYVLQVTNTKGVQLPIAITLTQLLPTWQLKLTSLAARFTLGSYKTQQFTLFRTSIDHPSRPITVTLSCALNR